VEGLRNNSAYLSQLEEDLDLLLLQEHWMFKCEHPTLTEYTNYEHGKAKSVDEYNPLSPWRLPRGYGGVAAIWSEKIHHRIKVDTDAVASPRVMVTSFKCSTCSYILINCYMPSGNSKRIRDEYLDTIQMLSAILGLYKGGNNILVLTGDMNVDLFNRAKKYDERRPALTKLLKLYGMQVLTDGCTPTMWAHDNRSQSVIDIVATDAESTDNIDVRILDMVPWNTSCHVPIIVTITLPVTDAATEPNKGSDPPVYKRPEKVMWPTLDKTRYQEAVKTALSKADANLLDPEGIVKILVEAMVSGAKQAAEVKNSSKRRSRRQRLPKLVVDAWSKPEGSISSGRAVGVRIMATPFPLCVENLLEQ
jgi:hypothetical protein